MYKYGDKGSWPKYTLNTDFIKWVLNGMRLIRYKKVYCYDPNTKCDKMEVSKEIIKLVEEIKKFNTDIKLIEELKIKKEVLESQVKELEESIKILKLNTTKQNELLEQTKELEKEKKKLKLDLDELRGAYAFVVTMPNEATIYDEISRELSKAQQEVLICSPWITYIIDELLIKKDDGKKKIDIRIITRLIKEDFDKGITDLNKFRALKDFGAEIRYNNNLHAKIAIVDNSVAIISSANLTKKGLSVNYEAGICLKDKNTINKVIQFFNDVWKESKPLTQKSIKNILSK
jgi:phosphatidylserine/phosphatidylglycerophosphate/cardiolipin synthase-like enzyme